MPLVPPVTNVISVAPLMSGISTRPNGNGKAGRLRGSAAPV
jgi:hypothetical protein